MFKGIAAVFVLIAFVLPAHSATIYVPDAYPTIQDAINASANGDMIIVRPGTYVENIDFVGKAITVQSEKGSSQTVIDGSQSGSVVTFKAGEGPTSILEGFSVVNGKSIHGGGVLCDNGSCPVITKNTIADNHVVDPYGAGGGILCIEFSNPTIVDNFIVDNLAMEPNCSGGGILCFDSSPTIKTNVIAGNAAVWGSGVYSYRTSHPIIDSNRIHDNNGKGAIFCFADSAIIVNNLIFNNSGSHGGGIYCTTNNSPEIINNCIYGNSASAGGGIYCRDNSSPNVVNTILWNNSATYGNEICLSSYSSVSSISVAFSDVQGGAGAVYIESGCTLNWGKGNIDADPLFVDPANADYHITWMSPCRDVGDSSVVTGLFDYEGDPRIAFYTVDIGADEFYYHLYYQGEAIPGGRIDIKIVGYPLAPVTLFLGSGIIDPPYSTQHGEFHLLWPTIWIGKIGKIPTSGTTGVLSYKATVPSSWIAGEERPFQALVGPWGGFYSRLTNFMMLTVE